MSFHCAAADLKLSHCYQLLVAVQKFFAPGRPERIPSRRRTRSGHDRGAAAAVQCSFQIWCVTSIWAALYGSSPQLPCRSGPPGGGTTARGGCPRQPTAHIYLPNHGNVAREMQEKGDHRQESVWGVGWNLGAEKGPCRRDLGPMIHIGHL